MRRPLLLSWDGLHRVRQCPATAIGDQRPWSRVVTGRTPQLSAISVCRHLPVTCHLSPGFSRPRQLGYAATASPGAAKPKRITPNGSPSTHVTLMPQRRSRTATSPTDQPTNQPQHPGPSITRPDRWGSGSSRASARPAPSSAHPQDRDRSRAGTHCAKHDQDPRSRRHRVGRCYRSLHLRSSGPRSVIDRVTLRLNPAETKRPGWFPCPTPREAARLPPYGAPGDCSGAGHRAQHQAADRE